MNDQQQPQGDPGDAGAPSPAPEFVEPTPVVIVGDQRDTAVVEPREPAEAPKFTPPKDNTDSGRFAAYDTTLGKFVGGVHDSRSKARKAGDASGAASFETVEV